MWFVSNNGHDVGWLYLLCMWFVSNNGHDVGWLAGLWDTILKDNDLRMIHPNIDTNWLFGFGGSLNKNCIEPSDGLWLWWVECSIIKEELLVLAEWIYFFLSFSYCFMSTSLFFQQKQNISLINIKFTKKSKILCKILS